MGRECYGGPACLCAFVFVWTVLLPPTTGNRRKCVYTTTHGKTLKKCQPFFHACLHTYMGSFFSLRWTGSENQIFFSPPYSCEKGLGSSPSFNNSSFSIITKDLALAAVQHRTGSYSKAEGRGLVVTKWRQVEDHRISPLFHTYSQYVWESGWCEHSATPFQSTKMRRATAWHDVPGERRPGLAHHVLLHNSKPPPTT
jgi:hypothetical protein